MARYSTEHPQIVRHMSESSHEMKSCSFTLSMDKARGAVSQLTSSSLQRVMQKLKASLTKFANPASSWIRLPPVSERKPPELPLVCEEGGHACARRQAVAGWLDPSRVPRCFSVSCASRRQK